MLNQKSPLFSFLKRYVKSEILSSKHYVVEDFPLLSKHFLNKNGLEVGGPSKIFSRKIPIYHIAANLDGCNFSNSTIWEGNIDSNNGYRYFNKKKGYQYISEASNLHEIDDEYYDFLISSHCLEHCANTIKTVKEWLRVLKKNGVILLVLPEKKFTFDYYRPITKFQHLLEDYNNNVGEDDLEHLDEILKLHELELDPAAGTPEEFEKRSLRNYENRCLHHHVFDFDLLEEVFNYLNIEMIFKSFEEPHHNIILGLKR